MKFTIVMPVLNGEQFLDAAIQSILLQTYLNWELIVIDGGSSDRSLEIVERHQKLDKRVNVFHQQGQGIYDAIFDGFDRSQGDLLCWLNCDDLYPHWTLNSVSKHFEEHGDSAWVNGFPGVWGPDGNLKYLLPLALWPQTFIRRGYFHPEFLGCIQAESTFFRKNLIDNLTPSERDAIINTQLAGDFLLWKTIAKYAKLETIPTLLGGFRIHGNNRSIKNISVYMDEVYATGVLRLPRRISILMGRVYRWVSSISSYQKCRHMVNKVNSEVTNMLI